MGFALLRCVIGRENSRFFLNQSDAKLKPVTIWSPAFCRALVELFLLWLSLTHKGISLLLVDRCDWFGLGYTTLDRKALYVHVVEFRVWSLFKAPHDLKSYFCKCTHIYDFFDSDEFANFFFRFFLATPMLGKIFGVVWKIIYTLLHHNRLTLRNNEFVSSPLAFYIIQQTV